MSDANSFTNDLVSPQHAPLNSMDNEAKENHVVRLHFNSDVIVRQPSQEKLIAEVKNPLQTPQKGAPKSKSERNF